MKNFSGKKNSTIYTAVIILAVIAMVVVFFTVDRKSTNSIDTKVAPPQDAAVAVNSILMPQAASHSETLISLHDEQRIWL